MTAAGGDRFPHLGFNPVPGLPDDVAGLRDRIHDAERAVNDTGRVLARLRNSNDAVWQGQGGEAFRNHFDSTLARDLGYAQHSLERAVGVLDTWQHALTGFRDTARGLDTEAATAREQLGQAQTTLAQARTNPDLTLANHSFTDPAQLRDAQTRLDTAAAQVHTATAAVASAQASLDAILHRAHDLADDCEALARKAAAELESAAKDFAPNPPGKKWWQHITDALRGVGDWISEHRTLVHNILSTVAAIGGLVALFTPPPFDAIGLAVGVIASAANVGLDLTDPKIRHDIGDFATGIWHGDFHSGDLKSLVTVGLDSIGTAPSLQAVKGVTQLGSLAAEAAEAGQAAPTLANVLSDAAKAPGLMTKGINKLGIPDTWLGVGAHANPELAQMNRLDTLELLSRSQKAVGATYHDIRDGLFS